MSLYSNCCSSTHQAYHFCLMNIFDDIHLYCECAYRVAIYAQRRCRHEVGINIRSISGLIFDCPMSRRRSGSLPSLAPLAGYAASFVPLTCGPTSTFHSVRWALYYCCRSDGSSSAGLQLSLPLQSSGWHVLIAISDVVMWLREEYRI